MDSEKQQKLLDNASKVARQNFRYMWRERFWDMRRKEPLCQFFGIRCTISEEINGQKVQEQFWLSDILCDGNYVHGVVQVQPNTLQSIEQGSMCAVPLDRVEDWMYVIKNRVYGGYTINVVRSTLRPQDLATYDASWGFEFGNPLYPEKFPKKKVVIEEEDEPEPEPTKFFGVVISKGKKKKKGKQQEEEEQSEYDTVDLNYDHPQAVARYDNYLATYKKDPIKVNDVDENGWTPLLNHSLAGNRHIVQLLVDMGADLNARTHHGHSARDLAKLLGWAKISEILKNAGAS